MAVDLLHSGSIELYGGSHGVRDTALIESALSRPVNRWMYAPECDLADIAASYAYGLAKNHGYVDGNKRIAFTAMFVFLYRNGLLLEAADDVAIETMIGVASGELGEGELAEWIRSRVVPRK
ncbi:MAG TPA: type II toxin-antitoxin system death-on-curing family toxin [Longimicrobium sp.]|jgi:death-on-curing protein